MIARARVPNPRDGNVAGPRDAGVGRGDLLDEDHDAMLKLYRERYSLQIEAVGSEAILSAWSA